jgi:nucleoside transporter
MKRYIRFQLAVMMFLQFFTWAAWYVTMGTYMAKSLSADGIQIGNAYSAMALATVISPFFVGIIADRFFPAQKLYSALHLAGACILFYITKITNPGIFPWAVLIYAMLYAPTLALTNTIAFNQMRDPGKQFSAVRIWGTTGWIATGWLIDKVFKLDITELALTFKIAATSSLLLGILAFFLPDTPPRAKDSKPSLAQIAGADAFVLFKSQSFLVFFISSILICIPLAFYYSQTNQYLTETGMREATSTMTWGQVSEGLFILLIPFFFKRFGVKIMILMGIFAWMARFTFFAFGNIDANYWMLIAGILLHGVCFDFFFVTGQIYTNSKAGKKIKNSAQGMITMATYGIGMTIGSVLAGIVAKKYSISQNAHNWQAIWMVPASIALLVFIFFLLFFRERKTITAI